ncbi:MAG TPA: DUF3995 domain-containing protein [Epsilonproteobacteria bacterium]|nr:DUF3995 domain-containing protein [Campylobacterota bacterium]
MILTVILVLLALMHLYWLFGEIGMEQALPTDDQGKRLLNPSKLMTLSVAFVLFGFAWISYMLDTPHKVWIDSAGWVLAIMFFLRAIGDFKILGVFKKVKTTEFAKYDTWVYVPLCFMIALGFVLKLL